MCPFESPIKTNHNKKKDTRFYPINYPNQSISQALLPCCSNKVGTNLVFFQRSGVKYLYVSSKASYVAFKKFPLVLVLPFDDV